MEGFPQLAVSINLALVLAFQDRDPILLQVLDHASHPDQTKFQVMMRW